MCKKGTSVLLRLTGADILRTHYLYGALFENPVIGEISKCLAHSGRRPRVCFPATDLQLWMTLTW